MKKYVFGGLILATLIGGVVFGSSSMPESVTQPTEAMEIITTEVEVPDGMEVATFAAGCFWCTEAVFQEQDGIGDVISGYVGGQEPNPTYGDVIDGRTSHREGVQFFYDPSIITYDQLLDLLWQAIDPTDAGGQFVDRGFSYTTAIYFHSDEQEQIARNSLSALQQSGRFDQPIVTQLLPFTTFYQAEAFHQDYYINAAENYQRYESASGRDQYKAAIWADIQSE